jgi:hypothetical protein
VGVKDRIRWEVQWHPASGARIRRLVFTWCGARRLLLTLGIAGLVVVAGGLLAGLDGLLTRFAVNSARRQNTALRAQQEALREQAFDLVGRLFEGVDRGRRKAPLADTPGRAWEGQCPRLPARDTGNDGILAWLSEQGVRLETLGNALAAGQVEIGGKQVSVPALVRRGTVPVRNAAVLQVADVGSARRHAAAPARR